ncbi:hypothetical protein LZ30DRAFT_805357 [Colletotrichum cereale]|nr:hypothetical protein LZ30DRAFT_805357 [Colletotrichum cereale]
MCVSMSCQRLANICYSNFCCFDYYDVPSFSYSIIFCEFLQAAIVLICDYTGIPSRLFFDPMVALRVAPLLSSSCTFLYA